MKRNFYTNKFRAELFKTLALICFSPLGLAFIRVSINKEGTYFDYLNLDGILILFITYIGLHLIFKSLETYEIIDIKEQISNERHE